MYYRPLLGANARDAGRRWTVGALMGGGICQCYALRSCLSVAVVGLGSRFDWDSGKRGYVLSSFFWGYVSTMLLAATIVRRIGRANALAAGTVVASVLTGLVPLVAPRSFLGVCALRVLTGCAESATYPAVLALLETWAPDSTSRGRYVALCLGGDPVGTILGFLIAGALIRNNGAGTTLLGFGACFYVVAALTVPWFAAWRTVAGDGPDDHLEKPPASRGVPWTHVAKWNPPVHGTMLQHFAANWFSYTLLTELPSFLDDRFRISLDAAASLLVPIYVAYSVGQQCGGQLADVAVNRWHWKLKNVKVFIHLISYGGSAACILLVGALNSLHSVIACAALATFLLGLATSGSWGSNFLDLAPNRACGLYTISNFFANMSGILTPIVTSLLVHSPAQWSRVFALAALINVAALAVWVTVMSVEPIVH